MRSSVVHPLRQALAALLVALLMLVSAAPCTAFAAPGRHPAAEAPPTPAGEHHTGPVAACAQLACQHAVDLGTVLVTRVPNPSPATFALAFAAVLGRADAPATPATSPPLS